MAEAKRIKLSISINTLPPEMIEKILKLLNIMKICQARKICKQWKEIIDKGNLLKKAAGKLFVPFYAFDKINNLLCTYYDILMGFFFRKNLLHYCCWRLSS